MLEKKKYSNILVDTRYETMALIFAWFCLWNFLLGGKVSWFLVLMSFALTFSQNSSCMHARACMLRVHLETCGQSQMSLHRHQSPFLWEGLILSWNLSSRVGWLSSKPWDSSCLCPHSAGVTSTYYHVERAPFPLKLELRAVVIEPGSSGRAGSVLNHRTISWASCLTFPSLSKHSV